MTTKKVAKVTISLRQELVDLADRIAAEQSTTRSHVMAGLLEKEEQARIHARMAQAYREMAEENRRIAAEHLAADSKTLLRDTRWDE
ncbi:MAG: hypothetical protein EXR49_06925 [Dehalococcoidia bacterium]|nr:hypothetical protein [Dehalococcoidia bacterium]